jgi:hypothetical protein
MKKIFLILTAITMILTSCKKDETTPTSTSVSNSQSVKNVNPNIYQNAKSSVSIVEFPNGNFSETIYDIANPITPTGFVAMETNVVNDSIVKLMFERHIDGSIVENDTVIVNTKKFIHFDASVGKDSIKFTNCIVYAPWRSLSSYKRYLHVRFLKTSDTYSTTYSQMIR